MCENRSGDGPRQGGRWNESEKIPDGCDWCQRVLLMKMKEYMFKKDFVVNLAANSLLKSLNVIHDQGNASGDLKFISMCRKFISNHFSYITS